MFDFDLTEKVQTQIGNTLDTGEIDLKPIRNGDYIDFKTLASGDDLLLQQTSLLTIYQYGNDPVYKQNGNKWAEALLGEVLILAVLEELSQKILQMTHTIVMEYGVKNIDGQERLVIEYKAV